MTSPIHTPRTQGHDQVRSAPLASLLRMLADGQLDEVAARVAELVPDDSLLAEIVVADAAARAGRGRLPQLQALQHRAEAEPDRPLLLWWTIAILGERAFLDADLGAVPLAVAALSQMPDDPSAEVPLLYVRGRLRRIASALYLAAPSSESIAGHRSMRDGAVADFLHCDFTAEAAITRGLSAALQAIATWENVLENLSLVREARALLGDANQSVWVPLLDFLQAMVAFSAGDLTTADTALDALSCYRGRHVIFVGYARFARALCRLAAGTGAVADVDEIEQAIADLRRSHPRILPVTQLQTANVLVDLGARDAARRTGLAALDWPPTNAAVSLMGELLRIRLDALDGRLRPLDDVKVMLWRLEELGNVRQAGAVSLRMSHDHCRAGAMVEARALREWGLERIPRPHRRTNWETQWARPLAGADAVPLGQVGSVGTGSGGSGGQPGSIGQAGSVGQAGPAGQVTVRALAPVLEVEIDGAPVRLRDMAAKLLLALVVAYPSPLRVEQVVDVLWPDAPLGDPLRARLNTVVYRLRGVLGLDADRLLRSGDVLVLDAEGWDVDLFRLRGELDQHDVDRRRAALLAVRGNLCEVQFPDDGYFGEQRRVIAAEAACAIAALEQAADGSTDAELAAVNRCLDPTG